ncbi:MAG: SH3 domain-containing protein [Polaribacter sp.]|jgi:tetratricopeptide (TPR) repeat protein|nr:SH3 domain-containing protein [Polaribacter sp.]
MKKIVFLLWIVANSIAAQNADSLFVKANNFYKSGEFETAIENYKKIESQNLISSELYYNLGNSYYKLNKVGPSIYYYEKALLLNPLNEDVKKNLVFAKRLALDNIQKLPQTFSQKINTDYLQKLSYDKWAVLVLVFSIAGSILFLLFFFEETPSKKRLYFVTSIGCVLFFISALLITNNQYQLSKNKTEAIVFANKTEVRNAPTLNSEKIFTLHEGTKIIVLDMVDNWKKIKLADGKIGWIIASDITLLKPFKLN